MIQGMTGFAERSFHSDSLRLKVTLKSLNHRYFDWSSKGAPLGDVESRLRAACQKKLQRGRIEMNLEMHFPDPASWNFTVNEALLEKIISTLEKVSAKLGKRIDLSLDQIIRIPQIVELSRKEFTRTETDFIEACFERTLNEVILRRIEEGKETIRQIAVHLRSLGRSVDRIERLFKKQPAVIHRKLKRRLRDLNHNSMISEEKLAEETACLVQRYDLAEEILRLKSHRETLQKLLSPREAGPVGKRLDFMAQEIYREANTVGSKSQDIEITKETLAIKNQVESIRQHAQNLE